MTGAGQADLLFGGALSNKLRLPFRVQTFLGVNVMISMGRHRLCVPQVLLFAAAVFLGTAGLSNAGEPKLDAATLQKIKQATVHLQVKLIDGSIAQGSGFFSEAPGVILTNAHVLGMLAPDS